jgi:hypothetical protein
VVGTGYEGSLIRGDAMRPMTGFLMQRAEQAAPETWWLRWVGPWQYQISASQMNQYTAVPHAKIIGGRLPSHLPVIRIRRIAHYAVGKGDLNPSAASGMALQER